MSIHGLYTGYTGLNASQLGIDTASHNVANANTDGFTRQRVEQSARVPRDMVVGQLGTGVSVDDISRSRDAFLDARLRGALSSQASLQVSADLLGRAEGVLGEPDLGISRALDDLWATFEDLSLDPTDPGRRLGVLASLSATTSRFNAIAESFEALGADTSSRLSTRLDSINALLSEVAELNRTIPASAATGTTPNDLLDSRDLNLDAIAEALGAQVSTDNLGRSRVPLNGLALVDGLTANPLTWNPVSELLEHTSGFALNAGGSIGGLQSFITSDLPALRGKLDVLAVDLATALNATHQGGFSAAGVARGDLLTYDPADAARTLQVLISDPAELASSDDGSAPFPTHNGENARLLADLRNTLSAAGGTQSLLGATRGFVADIGGRTASATRAAATQADITASIGMNRSNAHGVSLDEEMINLIRYQRAFEAAARVVTMADQALDTLINRTGIVGR